jgi:hypothetical protein
MLASLRRLDARVARHLVGPTRGGGQCLLDAGAKLRTDDFVRIDT